MFSARNFLIFGFLLFVVSAFGQDQQKIDSLERLLKIPQADTERVNTLNLLASESRGIDPQKSKVYAQQAMELAEKSDYKKGLALAYGAYGIALGEIGM